MKVTVRQLVFERLEADINSGLIYIAGKEIPFTQKEKDLLFYFLRHQDKPIPKEILAEVILGSDASWLEDFNIVFTMVRQVVKKLAAYGCEGYIQEVQNGFYTLGKS
ncbi:MAG TPA: winged helix-turn-helix domain-containing protein [Chryseolinea sp.]